jgi:hypothetical protein
MPVVKENGIAGKEYNLISVKKTDPPAGVEGKDWYCYIIERYPARAGSSIVGKMRGSLKHVTSKAESFVEELNARSGFRGSRSTWSSRQQK